MAWENLQQVVLNGETYNLATLDNTGITWVANSNNQAYDENTSAVADGSSANGIFNISSSEVMNSYNNEKFYFSNGYYFLYWFYGSSYPQDCLTFTNSSDLGLVQAISRGTNRYPRLRGIIINHETQKARPWVYHQNALNDNYALVGDWLLTDNRDIQEGLLYQAIMASQPVSYTWESVASITGKGKTYRLTDILNINDGEAMNDVQYDGNLDFSAKSKVNNMISEVVIDENAVAVEYKVPAGNYTYTKLVYKRNSIPNDVDDGTAINIDPALTKVSISNISSGATYWFVIFTDKSTSEPYKFGTEENADELVLYDNGWVNSTYFDTDAEVVGQTQSEPISYNYEAKSNHLLIEYDNWRDTIYWRGVQVLFNKKTFPVWYTKIKLDLELYVKYNSQWDCIYVVSPFSSVHGLLLKDFNNGENVNYNTYTDSGVTYERYLIGNPNGGSPTPYEATDRWNTEAVSLLRSDGTYQDYVELMLEGVNQYHKASMKVYKITLVKGGENIIPQNANLNTWDMEYPEAFENTFDGKVNHLTLHTLYNLNEPLTINVNARAGYKYTFLCRACSPTGFSRGLNYGEILNPSSSSESARIKIDNSASEEMKTYGVEYDCETSGQVTFGFDFVPITDYATIRFEISDLMILESKI